MNNFFYLNAHSNLCTYCSSSIFCNLNWSVESKLRAVKKVFTNFSYENYEFFIHKTIFFSMSNRHKTYLIVRKYNILKLSNTLSSIIYYIWFVAFMKNIHGNSLTFASLTIRTIWFVKFEMKRAQWKYLNWQSLETSPGKKTTARSYVKHIYCNLWNESIFIRG